MAQLFKNNIFGVLQSGVSDSATSMTLTDASGFPAPTGGDFYLVTLVGFGGNGAESSWEIVKVTAKASNTLTVVRAQEGTTAVSWPGATQAQMRLTAGSLDAKASLESPAFTGTVSGVSKAMVGLSSADNTSDAAKPVSAAQQTALNLKADIASPTFTGTVGGITKAMVGLGNVDNTTDAGKPISTATQTALDARILTSARGVANGVASLDAGGKVPESQLPAVVISDVFSVASEVAMLALTAERGDIAVRSDLNKTFALSASPASTLANWVELRTPTDAVLSVAGKTGAVTLAKADVGLGSVDNTADSAKPVSTATQTALDGKQPLDADLTAIAALTGTTGLLKKTAANTWVLDAAAYTTNTGTVTSVGVSVPTGLSVTGSPVTASDTIAISYSAGYSIPTTAKQTNWDSAYGWGNHASAGYYASGGALGTPASGTLSNCTADGTNAVGFRNIPQNSKSAAYTLVLTDAGKCIFHPSADTTARIWTIPANASVAFPIGTAVTFINQHVAGSITISITADTMRLAGSGATGSRTLAANGIATAVKVTATEWIISGAGLT